MLSLAIVLWVLKSNMQESMLPSIGSISTPKWVLTYFGGSKYVASGTQQEPQNALKEGSSKKEACSINSQCLKDWNDLSEAAK